MNLLKETLEKLAEVGKTESDVLWVGDNTRYFTFEDFKKLADIEYDNGYGGAIILNSLKIFGEGWWLERAEYDGSEWWEYKTITKKPDIYFTPPSLIDYEIDRIIEEKTSGYFYTSNDTTLEEIETNLK